MENFIHKAIEAFTGTTGIQATEMPFNQVHDTGIDGMVDFAFPDGHEKILYEAKKEFRNHHLGQLIHLRQDHGPLIVIAETLYPNLRQELRAQNIGYLDTAGNAYLKINKNLIFIDGQKKPIEKAALKNKVFTKTGVKVIFEFLLNPELVNATYREIAERAEVALDTVYKVMNGLKEQNFILKLDKHRVRLTNTKDLLDRWMIAYEEKLKPTLGIGTFRFLKEEDFLNWKRLPLKNGETYWGGEPGGDQFTNYLKPAVLTLYTLETKSELIKNYRLVPDPKGNVKAYKKFWKWDEVNYDVAPPVLVYTDLMNTGDTRCIETAEKIYEELLQNKF